MSASGDDFFNYFDGRLNRGEIVELIDPEGFVHRPDLLGIIFWPLNHRRLPLNADIDVAHPFFEFGLHLSVPGEIRWSLSEYINDWTGLSVLSRLYVTFLFFHCELQWISSSEGVGLSDGDLRCESLPVLTRLVLELNDVAFLDFFQKYLENGRVGVSGKNLSLRGSLDIALQLLRNPMGMLFDKKWIGVDVGRGMSSDWVEAWSVAFLEF